MDCRTAKENIDLYIDGVLSSAQIEELYAHADLCESCKKELENALRLKKALAALGELKPPEGLALGAVRKARKRRSVPFAFISVAAAAVIALAVTLTSGILPNVQGGTEKNAAENVMMAAPAPAEGAQQDKAYAMDMAPTAAPEAPALEMVPAATEAPAAEEPAVEFSLSETDEMTTAQSQDVPQVAGKFEAPIPDHIVHVPDELGTDIRAALENMIVEYGFEYTSTNDEYTESVSFVVTDDILEPISELTADLDVGDGIKEGQIIEFVFTAQ